MALNPAQIKFKDTLSKTFSFKYFLLKKLPIAFISGLRIIYLSERKCVVSIPYKWFTQNPFRSMYFASQAMAAEMSTGILSMMAIQGYNPPFSMLLIKLEAVFIKKASGKVYFSCEEGEQIFNAVSKVAGTNEGITITIKSIGKLEDETIVSEFLITWSFKQKKSAL